MGGRACRNTFEKVCIETLLAESEARQEKLFPACPVFEKVVELVRNRPDARNFQFNNPVFVEYRIDKIAVFSVRIIGFLADFRVDILDFLYERFPLHFRNLRKDVDALRHLDFAYSFIPEL